MWECYRGDQAKQEEAVVRQKPSLPVFVCVYACECPHKMLDTFFFFAGNKNTQQSVNILPSAAVLQIKLQFLREMTGNNTQLWHSSD